MKPSQPLHFLRGLRIRFRRVAARLSTEQWMLVLGGIVLPPLVLLGLSSAVSSGEKQTASAPAKTEERVASRARLAEVDPEDLVDPLVPGEFLSDLGRAFEDGESSGLVTLGTRREQERFEKIREASRQRGGLNGLGFFRLDKSKDGVEVYEVRSGAASTLGVVMVKPSQGRWHIIGAGESMPGPQGKAKEENASAEHTISALSSLLEHPDQDVRGAAAEALQLLRRDQQKDSGPAPRSRPTPTSP